MTIEELKEEARKLGYNLVPRKEYVRLMPCTCGSNRREHWYMQGNYLFFKCCRCGKKSEPGETEREAIEKWNEMITKDQIGRSVNDA